MGATRIEWCDYTANFWRGCARVSEGCRFCYADAQSRRSPDVLGLWGPPGVGRRVVAAESYWRLPLKWDREAARRAAAWSEHVAELDMPAPPAGPHRPRVFCGSLMDWAEDWNGPMHRNGGEMSVADEEPNRWPSMRDESELLPIERQNIADGIYRRLTIHDVRRRMFDTIRATSNLDWLLLSKRPENVPAILTWQQGFLDWILDNPAIWIGTSVEDQATADKRIPALLRIPAAIRFLSIEPLIGPVSLPLFPSHCPHCGKPTDDHVIGLRGNRHEPCEWFCDRRECRDQKPLPSIDWVIVGGESGPNARPCNVEWIRWVVAQCRAAGVPCFVKQLGAHVAHTGADPRLSWAAGQWDHKTCRVTMKQPKGGDPAEWPEDLRVREFPERP